MPTLFARPSVFPILDSTNRYLADKARAGAPEGVVIVADEQTAGRGRRGRSWIAEPGSALLCSMLFRPRLDLRDAHLLQTIVSLSLHRCVHEIVGLEPELKWPNDLLIGGKKVAGLLSEIIVEDARYAIVVGLGVNLRWSEGFFTSSDDEVLSELSTRATTLEQLALHPVDRDGLLAQLLSFCETEYLALGEPGAAKSVMQRYRAVCSTIGRRVIVEAVDSSYEATAIDVTDSGRLVVRVDNVQRELDAADIVHLQAMPPSR